MPPLPRHAALLVALALLLPLTSPGKPASPAHPSDSVLPLADVLAAVRATHPALAATRARTAVRDAAASSAAAWDDPMIELMVKRDETNPFSASELELTLTQSLPLSGNNTRRAAVARAAAAEAATATSLAELTLLAAARATYLELAALEARLALLARTDALLGQLVADLTARYETGQRPQSDVLTAELERLILQERLLTAEGAAAARRSRLNTLMGRPETTPLPPPTPLADTFAEPPLEPYLAATRRQHPELLAAAAARDTATAQSTLAARAGRIDPVVLVRLKRLDGSSRAIDAIDTGIGFNLPWAQRDRYRSTATAAHSARDAAEADEAATLQRVLGLVHERWTQLATYRDRTLLYRERAVPLAHEAVAAAHRDFTANRIPLADLLNATRNLYQVEEDLLLFLADYHLAHAALLTAAGLTQPLPPASFPSP